MKHQIAGVLMSILALGTAWGQESLIGLWENEDEEDLRIFQFRTDGIVIYNEFSEGELEFVLVFPYIVDNDEITMSEGLAWAFNPATGQLDFADKTDGDTWVFDVSGDQVTLFPDLNQQFRSLNEFVENDLELDPEEDLGLDIDLVLEDQEVNEEELEAIFNMVFMATLIKVLEIDLTELGLDADAHIKDADVRDVLAVVQKQYPDGEGLPDSPLLHGMGEVLDQPWQALDFTRSDREIIVPPGPFTLPNGTTAVEAQSWGRIKTKYIP